MKLEKDESVKDVDKKLLWNINVKCPICREEYLLSGYIINLPLIGRVILSSGKCESCGYNYKDYRLAEIQEPRRLKLSVNSLEDLNSIVVRAGTASIKIPELGIVISPGPHSQGFITTVEGILVKVKSVMMMLRNDSSVNKERWNNKLDLLNKAMGGLIRFTLIIDDPEGVSVIISDKVVKEQIYGE